MDTSTFSPLLTLQEYIREYFTLASNKPHQHSWVGEIPHHIINFRQSLLQNSLIGVFIDYRDFSSFYVQTKIQKYWRTFGFVLVEKMENLFFFHFDDPHDKYSILQKSPCSIDGALLVLYDWQPGIIPKHLVFGPSKIWIQIHGLPLEYLSNEVGEALGIYAGPVLEVDWQPCIIPPTNYIRVLVEFNPTGPLILGVYVEINDIYHWIQFKYENVSKLCMRCGRIGHMQSECSDSVESIAPHLCPLSGSKIA